MNSGFQFKNSLIVVLETLIIFLLFINNSLCQLLFPRVDIAFGPGRYGPLPRSQSLPPISREIVQNLIFSYGTLAPDNYVQEQVILINGQFPGPSIRVRMFDTLIVQVINRLDHGIAVHFHGIRNYGMSESDGVPFVTQEPIPPGGAYRYIVQIGFQSGTFLYHLHSGLDSIWGFGPLIIEDGTELLAPFKKYSYFYEYTLILSQCWHESVKDLLEGITIKVPFEDLPETDSILINGKSYGNWSEEEGKTGLSLGYETLLVKPGQVYRFRIVGFGTDSILSFKIQGHTMKIIEVDGIITKPTEVTHLELNTGQRYSVLVKMNQNIDNYWITSEMIPGPGPKNGKAILQYEGAPDPSLMQTKIFSGESKEDGKNGEMWEWSQNLAANPEIRQPDIYPLPETVDREIIIRSSQRKDNPSDANGTVRFDINGEFYEKPEIPFLFQVRNKGINITNEPQVYQSETNKSIQMIFQNVASDEGVCKQHPWHIHGHTFYVIAHGAGEYNPTKDSKQIENEIENNKDSLVFRDVVTLCPSVLLNDSSNSNNSKSNETKVKVEHKGHHSSHHSDHKSQMDHKSNMLHSLYLENLPPGSGCGWVAIRFITDNPGVWLVHCHLTAHLIMGKQFVFYSHQKGNPRLYSYV